MCLFILSETHDNDWIIIISSRSSSSSSSSSSDSVIIIVIIIINIITISSSSSSSSSVIIIIELGQLSPDAKVFVAKSVIIYLLQETINDWYIQGQSRRDDCQPTVSTIHIIISVIIFLWF